MNIEILFYISVGVVIGYLAMNILRGEKVGCCGDGEDDFDEVEMADEKEIQIIEVIKKEGSINNNAVQKLLGVSDATATRYLQKLEDKEMIEQINSGKYTHYCLK